MPFSCVSANLGNTTRISIKLCYPFFISIGEDRCLCSESVGFFRCCSDPFGKPQTDPDHVCLPVVLFSVS